ncbi:MAG: putative rane-associated Zn-dependent protease [Actinomycetia bacterium]|nr:putative rane-associated Zn-dependent protease [Actinomycetes bacterium]
MRDPLAVDTKIEPRRAVVTVVAAALVVFALITLNPSVLGTIAVILAFFVMIMLHEFGHFVTAKRTGMKVTEFFVGFGPRIWSFTKGETEYGIKALPLGGYCKIVGMTNLEDVAPEDEPRTYRSKSYGARVLVASAGSLTHFAIALVLMFIVLTFGSLIQPTTTLAEVVKGQPAAIAGLEKGDRIQSIDGHRVRSWTDVRNVIAPKGGQTVSFVVERHGLFRTIKVKLASQTDLGAHRGYAGFLPTTHHVHYSPIAAAGKAPVEVWNIGRESIGALGKIFSLHGITSYVHTVSGSSTSPSDSSNRFISPVGLGTIAHDAVVAGWISVFGLLISINVFIGIFNLMPLLPFDGGHIAIATYEQLASLVKGKRVQVDVAKLLPLTVAVIGVLGFIFLSSLFLDISHPIQNPF